MGREDASGGTSAGGEERIGNERFVGVEDGVARESESAGQRASGGKSRARRELLIEYRLAELSVELAVERAGGARIELQSRDERVRSARQSGTLSRGKWPFT